MGVVAVGAAIGAVVGGAGAAIQSGGDFNAIWKGALVGAVGGAVGGWAAPALSGAIGGAVNAAGVSLGGAIAAGGLGGMASGALGTALNGGNSSDYLKNTLFGGATGAAAGGLMYGAGSALGSNGEMVAPETTPLDMSTGTSIEGATVPIQETTTGLGGSNVGGTAAVDPTLAVSTPTVTAPQLNADVGQPVMPNAAEGLQSLVSGTTNPSVMTQGVEAAPDAFGTSFDTAKSPMQWGSDINYQGPHVPSSGGQATDPFGNEQFWGQPESKVNATLEPYAKEMAARNTEIWKATSPEQPSLWNKITQGNNMQDTFLKTMQGQLMGNAIKGAGSIAGMGEARQNKQQLMDLYNTQMNQYNTQNAAANQYQQQLQATYDNPESYLNTPEALAARQQAMQKLLAQNAMAGRRTAGLSMQNQLMQNQLQNLAAYRQGLRGAVNYASPAGLGNTLQAAQAQSPTGNLFAGLGSMFAPAATYYLM